MQGDDIEDHHVMIWFVALIYTLIDINRNTKCKEVTKKGQFVPSYDMQFHFMEGIVLHSVFFKEVFSDCAPSAMIIVITFACMTEKSHF